MIRFYFHPTPNPLKISLFLEEAGLPYEVVPVDTSKGEQHLPAFRKINPNGKVPAIVDTDGPGGKEARVFDSSAILLYLADKTGKFGGSPEDRPELLSWLFFIASGLGPFSGQAVHFQFAAPAGLDYAVNRYRREAERHYQVVEDHLAGRGFHCRRQLHDRRHVALGLDRSRVARDAWRGRSARRLSEYQALVRVDRRASGRRARPRGRHRSCLQDGAGRASAAGAVPLELSPHGLTSTKDRDSTIRNDFWSF